MDKSYIILMYEFAARNLNTGFTKEELINFLAKNGIDTNDEWMDEKFGFLTMRDIYARHKDGQELYFLSPEAYYRHMDYLEMKAAQENAKDARKWAIVAIAISGALAFLQVVLSLIELYY